MYAIIIFFVLNLINVILGTMRSILTVKSTPLVAVIINTLSYTFYSGIVKMTGEQAMAVVLATTALTNIIGVWVAKVLLNKMRKDKLWQITATVHNKVGVDFHRELIENGIACGYDNRGKWISFDCYSENQSQSLIIKELCKKYNAKVFVTEGLEL